MPPAPFEIVVTCCKTIHVVSSIRVFTIGLHTKDDILITQAKILDAWDVCVPGRGEGEDGARSNVDGRRPPKSLLIDQASSLGPVASTKSAS